MIPQLLIAKRLFLEAANYVDKNDPVAAGMAISALQDAVELYVWTVIKERSIAVKDGSPFLSNLEAMQKAGLPMPYAAKLHELNRARVNFKHYGNLPAPSEAVKHQTYVEDSLRQAMQDHFGVSFDDLSLVDLVSDDDIRNELRSAETHIAANDFQAAAVDLAKAKTLTFGQMKKYVPKIDTWAIRDGDELLGQIGRSRSASIFRKVAEYLDTLREATLVAMLQLPPDDYAFLRNNLPYAVRTLGGQWHINLGRSSYTEAECRRALKSIVSLCQRLQH